MIQLALLASFLGWAASGIAEPPQPTDAPGAKTAYFELRIYTVISGKMEGVLERFRDTVDPVRRKHGIDTLGYWSVRGTTNGGTFAYLLTASSKEDLQKREKEFGADLRFKEGFAASQKKYGSTVDRIESFSLSTDQSSRRDFSTAAKPRAFDLRIYSIEPGKLETFRNRWRDHAVPIYERHGLHSLGWWVAEQKDAAVPDQFICLLAGQSVPSILESITEFHKDAEWIAVEKETEAGGKLRSGVTAYKLTPTEFSPIK